jgi:hypothetical protein
MPRVKHLNRHQKRAFKPGEARVSGEEIWRLVELSKSSDPQDRLEAANNLCPCHVRRRIDEVWDALYRMMEDLDVRVRRAAYHTLEDGGKPDDPKLEAIFEKAWSKETDKQVTTFLKMFTQGRGGREKVEMKAAMVSKYADRGKCDFCGESNQPVRTDFDTEIPEGGSRRLALVCESCDG